MENEKEKIIQNKQIILSRYYRVFLFFVMVSIESILNVSSGIFSSATKEIKSRLKISDAKFGSFGTANSTGRVISSILFGIINQKVSRKWTTILFVSFHAFFLFFFKFTDNIHILIIFRGLLGFTQTTASVYVPVWINQFGLSEYKTVQITSIQLFQTIGKLLGHLITLILGLDNWKNGFALEGFILLVLAFCCLISSEDYFSRTLFPRKTENSKKRLSYTIYEEQDINKNEKNKDNKKGNYFSDLAQLLSNPLYLFSLISRCIIHGLNTCLHYWFSDFLRTVIKEKQIYVTISYSIICLAGPFGGIITNYLLKPYIGNYESRKSSWPIVFLQLIASFFAISIGLMKTTITVCIITVIFLIFNSSALPLIQGILISCTEKNLSATAFAFASTCTQLITAGTTPMIYGMINDKYKDKYPWLAMVSMMSLNLFAVPLLIFLAILRNKKFDEEEKRKEQSEELNDI
jgi:MFS family permease